MKPEIATRDVPDALEVKATVLGEDEYWVFRYSDAVPEEPYTKWAGPFQTKNQAELYLRKQPLPINSLRVGKAITVLF